MENSQIKIFIDSAKPYYHPGEQFLASILLDVLDKVNCNKMIIIAKGKQIIKATQKKKFEDTEENVDDEEYDDEEEDLKNSDPIVEIDESKNLFKFSKVIQISDNDYLEKGKYTFPFEVELPENIPGSFLYLEGKTYAEIIYSIKVKLSNINIEESIPIIIRQKEEIFNYSNSSEYFKNLPGCCCEMNQSKIAINTNEKYIINGNDIKVNINIDNTKSGFSGSPLNCEVYQKLILKNKNKNKRIKVTRIVGIKKGKKIINPKEDFNKKISITLDNINYVSQHLSQTNSNKYFKNKNIIPLLNQSIKSDFISNEYEIYAETQFSNLSADELGVFLSILIYPPEEGILSKNIVNMSNEFSNSIINNKKIFLNKKTLDNDPDFENNKIKYNNKNNNKNDNESSNSDKNNLHKKNIMINRYEDENNNENNINNINNINKEEDKKINNYANDNINNINNEEDNKINNYANDNYNNINSSRNKNENIFNDNNNISENLNIFESQNNFNNNNDNNIKKSNRNTEEISFGTSTKDKLNLFNAETTSNNIKKNFDQGFLNDALDDDNLDLDSIN